MKIMEDEFVVNISFEKTFWVFVVSVFFTLFFSTLCFFGFDEISTKEKIFLIIGVFSFILCDVIFINFWLKNKHKKKIFIINSDGILYIPIIKMFKNPKDPQFSPVLIRFKHIRNVYIYTVRHYRYKDKYLILNLNTSIRGTEKFKILLPLLDCTPEKIVSVIEERKKLLKLD